VWASPGELIVLLDVSESVFPIFDDLVEYLLRTTLTDQMKIGDTFHLMTFAGYTEIIFEKKITSEEDIEDAVSNILLLHPLGRYTDLVRAMKDLYEYVLLLPQDTEKTILVLTDGVHDPPPDSPYNYSDEETAAVLQETAEKIKRMGWEVFLLRLPQETQRSGEDIPKTDEYERTEAGTSEDVLLENQAGEEPETKQPSVSDDQQGTDIDSFITALDIDAGNYTEENREEITNITFGVPKITFPAPLGEVKNKTRVSFGVKNFSNEKVLVKLNSILYEGKNILIKPASVLLEPDEENTLKTKIQFPEYLTPGSHSLEITLEFDEDLLVSPSKGYLNVTLTGKSGEDKIRNISDILPFFIIILIAAVILILFFVLRKFMQGVSGGSGVHGQVKFQTDKTFINAEHRPLELNVKNQNHNIGLRNVQAIRKNSPLGVGGRGSSFLIFIVDFPKNIGEIRYDGESYTFSVLQPEYFPEGAEDIKDCLGVEITAVCRQGHAVTFLFQEYISKLEKINLIMHLADKPGQP